MPYKSKVYNQNMHKFNTYFRLFFLLNLLWGAWSYSHADVSDTVKLSTHYSSAAYTAGDTAILAITLQIPKGFHLYGNPLGPGIGKPLQLSHNSADPQGITFDSWFVPPAKKYQPEIGEWVWAYTGEVTLFAKLIVSDSSSQHTNFELVLAGLICDKACLPFEKRISGALPSRAKVGTNDDMKSEHFADSPHLQQLFSKAQKRQPVEALHSQSSSSGSIAGLAGLAVSSEQSLVSDPGKSNPHQWDFSVQEPSVEYNWLLAVLFGLLAGIILNAMPCVLPVLGLKILALAQSANGKNSASPLRRSLVFAFGMVSVFLVLATFAAFAQVSWGEQFQHPAVLIGIIVVIVLFALGLFDFYHILMPQNVGKASQKTSGFFSSDFSKGAFTTLMATPCSGPFLGATLAWTLTQPAVIIYVVFTAIGVGMASPYVLFASSKRAMKLLPKPGQWMNDFKHAMGFLLLFFAVYLLIGLKQHQIIATVAFALAITLMVAAYGRFAPFGASRAKKSVVLVILLGILGGSCYFLYGIAAPILGGTASKNQDSSSAWEPFSVELFNNLQRQNRSIAIDFTATWCMNCQYNKIVVFSDPAIKKLFEQKDVALLRADLTNKNPEAESLQRALGSQSIPLFAIFSADAPQKPVVLRDILSKNKVAAQLKKLP